MELVSAIKSSPVPRRPSDAKGVLKALSHKSTESKGVPSNSKLPLLSLLVHLILEMERLLESVQGDQGPLPMMHAQQNLAVQCWSPRMSLAMPGTSVFLAHLVILGKSQQQG